jgi:glutamine synthetase
MNPSDSKESSRILKELVKSEGAGAIDLKFPDLIGRWHHLTVSVAVNNPRLFEIGVGIDGSSLGYSSVKSGDLSIIPDLSTAFIDPFFTERTLSFLCDIYDCKIAEPCPLDPRSVARRAEAYLANKYPGWQVRFSPEFEFYIFDRVSYATDPQLSYFQIDSEETDDEEMLGYRIKEQKGYHAILPNDSHHHLRSAICKQLETLGIEVKYHHHEVGASGQEEIELGFSSLLKCADNTMLIKYTIRNLAVEEGLSATFMPKPIHRAAGTGLHVHQFLTDQNGNSLFYDPDNPEELSTIGRWYVGGLMHCGRSLFALTNPSINSYRRLMPGFESPIYLFYSEANRTAAIRIPAYSKSKKEMRIEYRPPDATANPYLSLSAMLLAGIYGIEEKIDPGPPVAGDLAQLPKDIQRRFKKVPFTLDRALDELEADHDFLLAGNAFTDELIQIWLSEKREHELKEYAKRTTPFEFELYYDL